ncbi:MAG: NAD-dependent epimerase/dehydratase family protein [Candidatus Hydrogenedentes bacterium]|jgi:CDP-paratose 2-epimerase|nr:NAD-dependent epimerase/dehydratase family protein [Candidatus Hydrogenedentota bacterium]
MGAIIVTGSAGLIGSSAVRLFADQGYTVVGIDNDMRAYFFGEKASTQFMAEQLEEEIPAYRHVAIDIRDYDKLEQCFKDYGKDIVSVVHTAAQPSHDWAAREPHTDFSINATGTLNLLELTRIHAPDSVFIFTSTNKVYGDRPNYLPLVEQELRWELDPSHPYAAEGIDESMSIDQCKHSLFGVSKAAADIMVQEYGRYFGMKSAIFRGGCLTGPGHAGAELHGFLAYLMKCAVTKTPYHIFGYKGKQVRDNIHASDLVACFQEVINAPRVAEVYNIGGGRFSNCSLLEAVQMCEEITGNPMETDYTETNRIGDHIWWISDLRKFKSHYPNWKANFDIQAILKQIYLDITRRERRSS